MSYMRELTGLSLGLCLMCVADTALAQGRGLPSDGTRDSRVVSRETRDQQSDYNRVIGTGVSTRSGQDGEKPSKARPVPAGPEDFQIGRTVTDRTGDAIATIDSLEGQDVILQTGGSKIRIPKEVFGKVGGILMLNLTAKEFGAAVAQATSGG